MKEKILECFLSRNRLRFSEIVKAVRERSNLVSYHLGKLVDSGILVKDGDFYEMLDEGMVPYVSDKDALMVAVLVAIEKEGRVFLVERKKRPFLGKLALPGGRMVKGEGFDEAVKRIGKKFGVDAKFERVCSVTLEHVKRNNEKLHSFLLILVKARTEDDVEYVVVSEKKDFIIGSDYALIERDLGKSLDVDILETLD